MSFIKPFIPVAPRRSRKRQELVAASPPPPPPPPGPLEVVDVVDITPTESDLTVTCVFNTTEDEPLVGESFDPNKWAGRYSNNRYIGSGVSVLDYQRVEVYLVKEVDEPGANELVYTNDPSDIIDTLGRTLAAFSRAI